jgi:hypothetical protein
LFVNRQLTKAEEDDDGGVDKLNIKERIVIRTNGKSTRGRRNNNNGPNSSGPKKRQDKSQQQPQQQQPQQQQQQQFANSSWLDYANNDKFMRTCDDGECYCCIS